MRRDLKKSNSNNDTEEKMSSKKSNAKGGGITGKGIVSLICCFYCKNLYCVLLLSLANNVPSPLPNDEYTTPSGSPSDCN